MLGGDVAGATKERCTYAEATADHVHWLIF